MLDMLERNSAATNHASIEKVKFTWVLSDGGTDEYKPDFMAIQLRHKDE